jgi:hypothetical protein
MKASGTQGPFDLDPDNEGPGEEYAPQSHEQSEAFHEAAAKAVKRAISKFSGGDPKKHIRALDMLRSLAQNLANEDEVKDQVQKN